ncbi:helix-turn-helix domain-containing protein [Methanotorris igneus]|uniref:Putative KaiC associated regulatory domain protein n=1 Tax=Methanotorris igneus (strain DSM 5666 / JCM 11834 / Kol 5) TaxID=880724 RepID=F6BEP8_METIK|nr:HTH domain-containing protein [Methanotorris igneus]AEF96845.1 putative KaiC associated regulatory domain protein [Methanotorris igneus Kol 5]
MEVPIVPKSRREIHQLETMLLLGTLLQPKVLEIIKDPVEKLTWVDSLAVASGALAREKAGMTVSEIAEELGRTEQTIRKHLKGETKAGEFVKETYELLKKGELKLGDLEAQVELISAEEKIKKLEEEVKELEEQKKTLEENLGKVKDTLKKLLDEL